MIEPECFFSGSTIGGLDSPGRTELIVRLKWFGRASGKFPIAQSLRDMDNEALKPVRKGC